MSALRCKFCGAEPSATVTLHRDDRFACRDRSGCMERQRERELESRQGRLFVDEREERRWAREHPEEAARCRREVDRAVDRRGRAA